MKRAWSVFGIVTLILFHAGCGTAGPGGEGASIRHTVPRITSDQAVDIAKKRLETESFADSIDAARMTVKYCPDFGPRKAPFACWVVDFSKVKSPEISAGTGLWAEGYQVLIDPETGEVKEATPYRR